VEYHGLPATRTSQIATVIYRQSEMLYAFRLAMQHSIRLDVGALLGVAVPVGAVRD
tara:strand:+ start:5636 stop:5803 length:168 start_codon:yes stop_codon:yes gene_type:complete